MGEIFDGVGLHEVVVPVVCFAICIAFQTWEIAGCHDKFDKCRGLFKAVRAGWVKENYMKGTIAVNTTRDYLKSAVFFASSAITLTTVTVGYAEFDGVPIRQSLLVKVFNHAHWYNSLGMRLFFGTIPVFAWIFHSWALLVITPMYVYMVWGLEDAGFVKDDLEEAEKQRTSLAAPIGGAAAPLGSEQDSMKRH